MNDNRLMIRLIDVALIILLGFIAISRLKTEYVDLPAPGEATPPKSKIHRATVHIYKNSFFVVDGKRKQRVRKVEDLESVLVRKNSSYRRSRAKLVMEIQPHTASLMQSLIDVLDICQRNNIEKNISYDSIN